MEISIGHSPCNQSVQFILNYQLCSSIVVPPICYAGIYRYYNFTALRAPRPSASASDCVNCKSQIIVTFITPRENPKRPSPTGRSLGFLSGGSKEIGQNLDNGSENSENQ